MDDNFLAGDFDSDEYDIDNEKEELLLQDEDCSMGKNRSDRVDANLEVDRHNSMDMEPQEDILNLSVEEDLNDDDKNTTFEEDKEERNIRNSKFKSERTNLNFSSVKDTKFSTIRKQPTTSRPNESTRTRHTVQKWRKGNFRNNSRTSNYRPAFKDRRDERKNGTVLINPRFKGVVQADNNARLAWDNQNAAPNAQIINPWASGNVPGAMVNQTGMTNYVPGVLGHFQPQTNFSSGPQSAYQSTSQLLMPSSERPSLLQNPISHYSQQQPDWNIYDGCDYNTYDHQNELQSVPQNRQLNNVTSSSFCGTSYDPVMNYPSSLPYNNSQQTNYDHSYNLSNYGQNTTVPMNRGIMFEPPQPKMKTNNNNNHHNNSNCMYQQYKHNNRSFTRNNKFINNNISNKKPLYHKQNYELNKRMVKVNYSRNEANTNLVKVKQIEKHEDKTKFHQKSIEDSSQLQQQQQQQQPVKKVTNNRNDAEEDEETRIYRLRIEEQKKARERIFKMKEERRLNAIRQQQDVEAKNTESIKMVQTVKIPPTIKTHHHHHQNVNYVQTMKTIPVVSMTRPTAQVLQKPSNNMLNIVTNNINNKSATNIVNNEIPTIINSGSNLMPNRLVYLKNNSNNNSNNNNNIIAPPVLSKSVSEDGTDGSSHLSSFLNNRKILAKDHSLLNTRLVVISNLSASTNPNKIVDMSKGIGEIQNLKLDKTERHATILFKTVASAHLFFKKYQRHMLDLSMIEVKLEPML